MNRHECPSDPRAAGGLAARADCRPARLRRAHAGHLRNTYKRTHRWDKVLRDQDELALIGKEDKLLHVLFSTIPDDLDLYGKPMARNVQIWTEDTELLLDGPHADAADIKRAMRTVAGGRRVRLPLLFPAMRVGQARGLLASAAGRLPRRAGEAAVLARRPARLPDRLRRRQAAARTAPSSCGRALQQRPVLLAAAGR